MKLINFYEVRDESGAIWGGNSALQAVEWYRSGIDYRLFASVWDEQDKDNPRLVTDKIDVTFLIMATIMSEQDKEKSRREYRREWLKR